MSHLSFQGLLLILALASHVACDSRRNVTPRRQGSTAGAQIAVKGSSATSPTGQDFRNVQSLPTVQEEDNRQRSSSKQQTTHGLNNGDVKGISVTCDVGQVRHVDGNCAVPEISRSIFLYDPPKQPRRRSGRPPLLPPPRLERNIMFVKLPRGGPRNPVIIPPPKQSTIVYVLNKVNKRDRKVVELPAIPPSEPEVFFVNYDDGKNPSLPGGYDLESALSAATPTNGQVIKDSDEHPNSGLSLDPQGFGGREDQNKKNAKTREYDPPNTDLEKRSLILENENEDRKRNLLVSKLSPVSVNYFTVSGNQQRRPSAFYS